MKLSKEISESTALILKKSKTGKREVEQMLKHPLSQKQLEEALKIHQKAKENLDILKKKGLL